MSEQRAGPTLEDEILRATAAGYRVRFEEGARLQRRSGESGRVVIVDVRSGDGEDRRAVIVEAMETAGIDLMALAIAESRGAIEKRSGKPETDKKGSG